MLYLQVYVVKHVCSVSYLLLVIYLLLFSAFILTASKK